MPTPYPFSSGQTLLASQMNSLSQLPTVSITSSSTAVATHSYSRVIANGSAITYTIPNNVFEARQVIEFHNINSTLVTIAAGAGVTLNAATAVTLEQYQSATIYATSASSFILFESHVRPGLELIKSQTIGSGVSSVTVTGAFSADYDNYRIIVNGGAASGTIALRLTLGATATGYYSSGFDTSYGGGNAQITQSNAAFWNFGGGSTNLLSGEVDLRQPFLSDQTTYFSEFAFAVTTANNSYSCGFLNDTTSYTAFTITTSTGTMTGGTIRVYGYRN